MAFSIENFLSPNLTNMLISFVIPFLIFFAMLLFVLKRTHVFGDGNFIYVLISLGLTVMIYAANPGGIFQFLASYLLQIGVMGSVIGMLIVIFLFVWAFVRGGVRIAERIGKSEEQKLHDLKKTEEKLMKQFYSEGLFGPNTAKRMQLQEELKRVKQQEDYYLARLKKLK